MKNPLHWVVFLCLWLPVEIFAAARWTKVTGPHFTFLTADSVSTAKEWAACLEAFQQSLNDLAPTDEELLDEMTMVIFDSQRSYYAFVSPGEKVNDERRSIYRYGNRYGRFIGAVNPDDTSVAQRGVFMMAGYWLTNSYRVPLPLWLGTGLQAVYADYIARGAKMTIGAIDDDIAQWVDADSKRLLPLERLMGMNTSDTSYQENSWNFNAQACVFVHYLLLGDNRIHRSKLQRYMSAIQRGDTEESARQQAFPEGLEELERQFVRYVRRHVYAVDDLPANLTTIKARIQVAPATAEDVLVAKGFLGLLLQGADQPDAYLEQLRQMAPDHPDTLEALAALADRRGDREQMLAHFRAAVAAGSNNYVAHYYASYAAVQRFYGQEAAADRCDQEAARQTVDSVKTLVKLRPNFLIGYQTLGLLIGSLVVVNDDDLEVLAAGLRRYPDDIRLRCGRLAGEIQRRKFEAAKAHLAELKAAAPSDAQQVAYYLKKLQARLGAVINLAVLEQRLAKSDQAAAEKVLALLNRAPLLPEEQARLVELRGQIAARKMLERARQRLAARDWSGAALLLDSVDTSALPKETAAEFSDLRGQIDQASKQ